MQQNDSHSQAPRPVPLCFLPTVPDDSGNTFPDDPKRGLLMLKSIRARYGRAAISHEPERNVLCMELLEQAREVVEGWRIQCARRWATPGFPPQDEELGRVVLVRDELASLQPSEILAWFKPAAA